MVYLNDLYNNAFLGMSSDEITRIVVKNKEQFIKLYSQLDVDEKKQVLLNLINAVNTGGDQTFDFFVEKINAKAIDCSVSELISYIVKHELYQVEDEVNLQGEFSSVSLSTVWRAKGGEWKHVFATISDMDSVSMIPTDEEIEEKRRLLFTMVTRTKGTLTISSVKKVSSSTEETGGRVHRYYQEMLRLGVPNDETCKDEKSSYFIHYENEQMS